MQKADESGMTSFEREQLRLMRQSNRAASIRQAILGFFMVVLGLWLLTIADAFGTFPKDGFLHRVAVQVEVAEQSLLSAIDKW